MDNIFQSKEWEELKLKTGYQKSYWVNDILVLQKKLPFGFSMLYSPMVDESQVESIKLSSYQEELKKIALHEKAIFYRLELNVPETTTFDFKLSTLNYAKSFEEMQPTTTWIMNLEQDLEEILAQMKPKGRYNIRVAKKNDVYIESGDEDLLDDFYKMYSDTAKRHQITYRSKKYFTSLVEALSDAGKLKIYNAYKNVDGKKIALASGIVVFNGETAIYMFGSSSDEYKNLKAPVLLHYEVIQDLKAKGLKNYDFYGIAPTDDEKHPWAGVTRFKKQFGGTQVDILGCYDLVFKPLMYQVFKLAEKIRRR